VGSCDGSGVEWSESVSAKLSVICLTYHQTRPVLFPMDVNKASLQFFQVQSIAQYSTNVQ
jgi:hypothetical protein